ncbi:MAG: phosphatidate cytidylyltransferase, partial [Chitinophagaceae bacterium]
MALNPRTFKIRAITALVFVAVMAGGLFWNHWSFFLLFSLVHFGCWIEYQQLVEKIAPAYRNSTLFHRYGVMFGGWCLMLYFTNDQLHAGGLTLTELGWWSGL